MGLFSKRGKTRPETVEVKPEPTTAPVAEPTPEPHARGKALMSSLMDHLPGVPQEAIKEEWNSRTNADVWPRQCPSVVPDAFFAFPCDEAVPFFERYVFDPDLLDKDYDPKVMEFVQRCKSRALATYVRDSMERFGPEETLRLVAEGLADDPKLATGLLSLVETS